MSFFNQKVIRLKARLKRISMLPGGLARRARFVEAHTTLITYSASHLPHNNGKALEKLTSNILEATYARPATVLRRRANEIISTVFMPAHRVLPECAVQYQSLMQMVRRVFQDNTSLVDFDTSLLASTGDGEPQKPKQTLKIAEALRHCWPHGVLMHLMESSISPGGRSGLRYASKRRNRFPVANC